MKSVCIVRHNYFPQEAHLCKNVAALVAAGYEVDVICLRQEGERARERHAGGIIYRLPLCHRRSSAARYAFEYLAFFTLAFALVSWLSLRKRYSIVEVYNLPDLLVFAALPAKLLRARIILYLFELMPEHIADQFGLSTKGFAVRLLRWLERLSIGFADRAIAVGFYDRIVRERRGIVPGKLALVMNTPDEELFNPERFAARAPEKNDSFRLMTHGSLLRRYGVQTLIRALPRLYQEIPNLEVWIVGDGEYRNELVRLAGELGVADRVRLPGWVAVEEVLGYLSRCDVGVVCQLAGWMLPNKLFEYVAMRKPVVAAAVPAIQSAFAGDAVAFFRPGDEQDLAGKVLELFRHPSLRAVMAERAHAAYQSYRWRIMKEAYLRVHEELLSSAAAPGRQPDSGGVGLGRNGK